MADLTDTGLADDVSDPLSRIDAVISQRGWLLADGAMGTNLFSAGLEAGEAPELWNETQPKVIEALARDAIQAGAELVLTNSFGCNPARLKLHSIEKRCCGLARISAEIARNAADAASGTVFVGGSVGPTGELMEPFGPLTHDSARSLFQEQIVGLKAGGADIIWIETMSDIRELSAAAAAAVMEDMPWCGCMSFDSSGLTMMGISASDLAVYIPSAPGKPFGIGANCGIGPADLVRTILELSAVGTGCHIVAKGNAGIPKFVSDEFHYDGTPQQMADYAELARDAGASIIGGCCGTTAEHLRFMRERLETTSKGNSPTMEEIVSRIGPPSHRSSSGKKRNRRGRSRTGSQSGS